MTQIGKLGGITITDGEASGLVLDATCDVTAAIGAGGDPSPLTADLDFAQFEALQFVLENRTSDPGAPVAGQMWLRTDL